MLIRAPSRMNSPAMNRVRSVSLNSSTCSTRTLFCEAIATPIVVTATRPDSGWNRSATANTVSTVARVITLWSWSGTR